jgi:N-acetylglucosaminyldiphosphoundecaprenol N-acetyl-beta-D-mannosaminyltransferase
MPAICWGATFVIDETDASDVSLLERRDGAENRPVIVATTTADGLVIVETTVDRPVLVETAVDGPAPGDTAVDSPERVEPTVDRLFLVPAMRDGDAAEAGLTAPLDIAAPADSAPAAPPQLQIGPFQVSDLSQDDVVSAIVSGTMAVREQRAWVSYALHVGGLNQRDDADYLGAMSRADLVYADGMSIIVLAKLAGARAAERAGTTDIGWTVMRRLTAALGRPVRVALIGGPEGLTRRAARVIEADAGAEVVLTEHGYHDDWASVLDQLARSGCDMVLVGLGAPREMIWVDEHVQSLPPCLVMTCGGWFGFITQDEKRAPQWVCDAGFEWTYRLGQSPRRLFKRYAKGALSTAKLAVEILRARDHSG